VYVFNDRHFKNVLGTQSRTLSMPLAVKSCSKQVYAVLMLLMVIFSHVTAVFTLAYDLPHDFAGYGMLNILAGVLPK